MKPRKNYEKAQAYSGREKLPVGGYVLKILNVEYLEYDWGDTILLSFDILEGEQKGFFNRDYHNQTQEDKKWRGTYRLRVPSDEDPEDDWKMRRFKTTINAFEGSNEGFHWNWDEQTLKGKVIGALFNSKEYEFKGKRGFFTNCHSLVSADRIRNGKFTIPADTLLKESDVQRPATETQKSDWMNIPDDIDNGMVPFS